MPRPTAKPELVNAANEEFKKMRQFIDAMPEEERYADFDLGEDFRQKEAHWKRDKNLRDVFAHLYEWHLLLLDWIAANKNGEAKPFIPEPYNWKTYGDMNTMFWERNQSVSYAESMAKLLETHAKTLSVIETFTDGELFESRHFSWTGTTTLGSYCVSATSSHYGWAIKKIKAFRKAYAERR